VRAFDPGQRGWGLQIISDTGPSTTYLLDTGAGVAITEPYSLRTGLTVGDELPLPISRDVGALPIVAVYRSYDAGGASVSMSLQKFREMTDDAGIDGIGVELRDGSPVTDVVRDIEDAVPPGAMRITTSAGIKRISLEIFDRTFLITEVLRLLAGAIAFLGMLSALMAVQIERRREFGILRSIGFAPRDLWRLIMTETAIIGTSAGLLAMPVGLLLAALLIYVINVRSFGWTMAFELQPLTLVPGAALAVFAALLAGIWPALRSYSEPVAAALRDDH
jgi:putative ABC transport system permease protein